MIKNYFSCHINCQLYNHIRLKKNKFEVHTWVILVYYISLKVSKISKIPKTQPHWLKKIVMQLVNPKANGRNNNIILVDQPQRRTPSLLALTVCTVLISRWNHDASKKENKPNKRNEKGVLLTKWIWLVLCDYVKYLDQLRKSSTKNIII